MIQTQAQIQKPATDSDRYARCIAASKRIRWDIDYDVIRGRQFDFDKKFLPDGLSKVSEITFLTEQEKVFFSQVQGRTYANMFGLVERFICAKVLDISHEHFFGDQVALEALVRLSDEELKHQELFRRLDAMAARYMPAGYNFVPQPNDVAKVVLGKSTWAVLGLILHIELFTQSHYRQSIEPDNELSPLWKDVFLFHWQEESQHAIVDELEWVREDKKLSDSERDNAVTDLIDLVIAIDGILQAQAQHDKNYFIDNCDREFNTQQADEIHKIFLKAYRWQYIISGVMVPHYNHVLASLVNAKQSTRIAQALEAIV